jgi:hypothetical protein
VDLEWAKISFPLRTRECVFKETLILRNSHLSCLHLIDTCIKSLNAEDLVSDQNILLSEGFRAEKGVDLAGARIGGNLECDGGRFFGETGTLALDLNGARIEGSVFLRRDSDGGKDFEAEGGVDLTGTTIGEDLDCDGGQFFGGPDVLALCANGVICHGSVFLRKGFKAEAGVDLIGTIIGGNLDCDGGQFFGNAKVPALDAHGAEIRCFVLLGDGFKAVGGVDLSAATIEGDLKCEKGGQFASKGERSPLDASRAKIKGSVVLWHGFKADGEVNLQIATIEGQLTCLGQFASKARERALNAIGAKIKGSVYLCQGFNADGGVDLSATKIEGDLNCHGGQFASKGERSALDASRARIEGSVFLSYGFKADGGASLLAATIEGNLVCTGGQFASEALEWALNANGAKIGGSVLLTEETAVDGKVGFGYATVTYNFQLWGVRSPEKAILDLGFAKVGRLLNDQNSWPSKGNLFLGGFVYDQIDDRASPNAEVQLRWLHLQPLRSVFLSQPYEQLAAVFREGGLEEDARQIMIEKNKEHGRHLHLPIWDWRRPLAWFDWVSAVFKWSWYRFFGNPLVGFGYRPGRAFGWSILVIALGWLFFKLGYDWKVVTPTGDKAYLVEKGGARRIKNGRPQLSEDYPKFNALVYSVETFVPLLKLGMGEYWGPNAKRDAPRDDGMLGKMAPKNFGSWLRCYMWLHIILGWFLGTLWIGGLTKLLKT